MNRIFSTVSSVVAGLIVATVLSVGVAAPAGALISHTPFCQAVFTWARHPVAPPTSLNVAHYHTWVNEELPYFEKMLATAPNAKTKEVLAFVVSVLKEYGSSSSVNKLALYEKAHSAQFGADVKVLAASIKSCISIGGFTLP